MDRASIGLGEEFQSDRRSRSASLSFAVDWASDRGYAQRIANVNEEKSPTQVTNIGMMFLANRQDFVPLFHSTDVSVGLARPLCAVATC